MILPGKDYGFRSEPSILLWNLYIRMPGLFRQISQIVCHQETISQEAIEQALKAGHEFRHEVAACRTQFELIPTFLAEARGSETIDQVLDSLWAMFGTSLALSIIGNRLHSAICHDEAGELEKETLMHAKQLRALCADASLSNPWAGLFLEQKRVASAESVLQTEEIWEQGIRGSRGIIEKWRFEAWCHAMPRRTCCEV
jgi:hypothetical protein